MWAEEGLLVYKLPCCGTYASLSVGFGAWRCKKRVYPIKKEGLPCLPAHEHVLSLNINLHNPVPMKR